MAIAFDAVTDLTQTTATSLTYSHTTTGSDRILFVGVRSTGTVTGVTYAGTAMVQQAFSDGTGGSGINNYIFSLFAPASGANNVVISMSSSIDIASGAMSYTGANQSNTLDATGTAVASATSITFTLTTVLDNCWLVMTGDNAGGGYTEGANTTRRYPVAGGNSKFGFDTNSAQTPAGSKSMSLSSAGSQGWTLVGASFAPVQAATTNANFLAFM